jgi:hypothetical protein
MPENPEPIDAPVPTSPNSRRSGSIDRHQDNATPNTPNLAEAIILMTEALKRPNKAKAKSKEPDTFDGSDPRKLNNFILLCNLYFRNNSSYSDDESKVTFALSYLRGTALDYYEPALMDPDDLPDWLDDWFLFVQSLRTQFGPHDPTADAEDSIDNLKMRENQRILKYNVDFNRLAVQTGWNDSVLRHRYYTGLAERIKDIMGQQGKPPTLPEMKSLAQAIDSRHWERLREKSRSDKPQSKPDNRPPSKPDNKSTPSENKKHNSGSTSNNNKQTPKPSSVPSIADKLGKDGKLNTSERQRRIDNNLCLYCGGTGHKADECKKSSSSASKAKARAVQAKEKDKDETKKA